MADLDAAYRNGDQPDLRVAAFAAERHAVATTAELLALGLTRSGIARRAASGRLHRRHRGVFAIGHANLTAEGRWVAAVLACGEQAVLSHRSAAALWGLRPTAARRIEVTVPGGGRPGPPDVHVHRTRVLTDEDVTERDRIPVTTVARTLVDLAEVLDRRSLSRAVHEAEVLRLLDVPAVWAAAARVRGRRRLRRLLRLLADPAPPTRSELELRFHELCTQAGLPAPEINATVSTAGGDYVVDALWRAERVVVELDGAAFHHTRRAFEGDRRRDADLTVAGYRVVRFTWRRLLEDPRAVIATLRTLLRPPG